MAARIFIIMLVLLIAPNCFGALAGNTSDPKVPYGPGLANTEASGFGPFKVSVDADGIIDRDLSGQDSVSDEKFEGIWGLCRIGYTFANRIEPYVKVGMSHLETSWKQNGHDIKVKGENSIAGGGGIKVLIFEIPEYRIRFSADGQYLYTDPDVDEAKVDNPNRTISAHQFKISEWQVAGLASMEFPLNYDKNNPAAVYSLIPYVGCAYLDSDVTAKFTYNNTVYSLNGDDEADNTHKFLVITGCDLTSPQNISLNVEGRWVGETSVGGGATVKF